MDWLTGNVSAGPGWAAFADPAQYLRFALVLLAATASGAVLAFHPVHRVRPRTRADLERRHTIVIYSVVGAIIAEICLVNPSMAFVIFGIGGLMRFRTDLGASKLTGHTIVATIVGLCWGLGLELVATLATAYFWLMVYVFDRHPVIELNVGGVEVEHMAAAEKAYRGALQAVGCRVTAHQKYFKKRAMQFSIELPAGTSHAEIAEQLETELEPLEGTADWSL